MQINQISYKNYRNIEELSLVPNNTMNVLIGANAQGKTNFIEGIYFGAMGRSLRSASDEQMINFNSQECHLQLKVSGAYTKNRIDVHIKQNSKKSKKSIAINGISAKKLSDLLGTLCVVCFSPEDLGLIKDNPARRRRFLDMELCQLDKIYYDNLQKYHKILKQRNNLLKNLKKTPNLKNTLDIWTEQLYTYAKPIILARETFLSKLNEIGSEKMSLLTGGIDTLKIQYKPNSTVENLKTKLENNIDREILLGNTQFGPHKDDINFIVNDIEGKTFASQGQQRSIVLSIKLAEIDIIYEETGEKPVLLLDDVFSELDENRQKFLMDSISGLQSFITCTGVEDVLKQYVSEDELIFVDNGKIKDKIV